MENREPIKRLRDAAAGSEVSRVLEVGVGGVWHSAMVPSEDGGGSGVRSRHPPESGYRIKSHT